jgi:hypothetical protein
VIHSCPTGYHAVPQRSCYAHGCECAGCATANRDYLRLYRRARRARASGVRSGLVDATRSIVAVRWLIDAGATNAWISAQAGVGNGEVSEVRRGERVRVRAVTADRLHALTRRVGSGEVLPPRVRSSTPDRPCASCERRERDRRHRLCKACQRSISAERDAA